MDLRPDGARRNIPRNRCFVEHSVRKIVILLLHQPDKDVVCRVNRQGERIVLIVITKACLPIGGIRKIALYVFGIESVPTVIEVNRQRNGGPSGSRGNDGRDCGVRAIIVLRIGHLASIHRRPKFHFKSFLCAGSPLAHANPTLFIIHDLVWILETEVSGILRCAVVVRVGGERGIGVRVAIDISRSRSTLVIHGAIDGRGRNECTCRIGVGAGGGR